MAYYLHVGGSAGIAQLVEQWIENPRVSSSNLDPGICLENRYTCSL